MWMGWIWLWEGPHPPPPPQLHPPPPPSWLPGSPTGRPVHRVQPEPASRAPAAANVSYTERRPFLWKVFLEYSYSRSRFSAQDVAFTKPSISKDDYFLCLSFVTSVLWVAPFVLFSPNYLPALIHKFEIFHSPPPPFNCQFSRQMATWCEFTRTSLT